VSDPSELDAELDAAALGGAARRLAELADANEPGLPTQVARARVRARMFEDEARPFELGRYVVLGVLGRGGMGIVYSAYDPELDRKVAIKLLRHDTSSEAQVRLKREARALWQGSRTPTCWRSTTWAPWCSRTMIVRMSMSRWSWSTGSRSPHGCAPSRARSERSSRS
jgi:hypothetical protein